ncbi:DUF1329 domain-containing protein [Burkholderia sp. Bp9143]|uniref:DUF1329 domain-containing protein n=1 Tax=Burkholderia sp. Bp9143 TaxID=2184574 RepID=UPI000F58F2E9|nr:DUF1329 domain-containing protein [Burkholderia sp. Bp9143]RQR22041.1 DUF1329 domain-containing protein [Burkholderia sp. Bp9143]
MSSKFRVASLLLGAVMCGSALGAVTADEAKELNGPTLTPWGAEKAGSKDGMIPAWTGEPLKVPADYDPQEPMRYPSPFKDEKPLYTITAQNMAQYADKMTEAQKLMMRKYPSFRMNVYPSHRVANYPKFVLDNTMKNATACTTVNHELVLKGCYGGLPFPIPKTGYEVMWNHLTRFTMPGWHMVAPGYLVPADGDPILTSVNDIHEALPFYHPVRSTPVDDKSLYWVIRFDQTAPARVVGSKYLMLDALDSLNIGRRSYSYLPGQRRVKLSPDLAYDTPNPTSGGVSTMDQSGIFTGAMDRYDIKLVGKQEKYIMYNNYELNDYKVCSAEKLLTKNYPNPDCIRWEPHRVWVLQLTLKSDYRHIMPKRTIYLDEDTYGAGASDDYDASGHLYRATQMPYIRVYNKNGGVGNLADCTHEYDFQSGSYHNTCVVRRKGDGAEEEAPKSMTFFSPDALAGEGIR